MSNQFSIYDSPLSDETKRIRRNSLIVSSACLFVGLSGTIPKKLVVLDIGSSSQPSLVGWFMFFVATYLFLHFLSAASVEIARWIHPFYVAVLTKKILLQHPGFNETDWMEWLGPENHHDLNEVAEIAEKHSDRKSQVKLRYLYNMIYLKLVIEIMAPLVIGVWGIASIFNLISAVN